MDPSAPGLQMHRIDKSKDANFWSVRTSRELRITVHKTAASLLLAFVGHHDEAYAWVERRRIEAHPRTGVAQIVEVRERVEERHLLYVACTRARDRLLVTGVKPGSEFLMDLTARRV